MLTYRHPAAAFALLAGASPVAAQTAPRDVLVVAARQRLETAPTPPVTLTADQIATTVNALNVEDTLKYLPSLVVRKRHIGDTQAPLATRTSGLGSSARSLIYADGALLSALIGNNNTLASPRWGLVSPEEIARIDVIYGPFAAAYPGNSIGAVVNITTRLPDRLEGTLTAASNVQTFRLYGTDRALPSRQLAATLGDRFGPLSFFASLTHTDSRAQPLGFATATRPALPSAAGVPAAGGYDDVNRTGAPIRVLGATQFEHQRQDNAKLKLALDVSAQLRLSYVGGLFVNHADAAAESYLSASGAPAYAGTFNIAGYAYVVPASTFAGGYYRYRERQWSHALSLTGGAGALDWQVIGTVFRFGHDAQRAPTLAPPAALRGGAGTITRLDGTGWQTLDAKLAWKGAGLGTISGGAHLDRFRVNSNRYPTADWIGGGEGALNLASRGRTRTAALWAQDELAFATPLTLTLGARYEWWRAYDGFNYSLAPALSVRQPVRRDQGVSPKATLAYALAPQWTARLSVGRALRFPTVGELYQAITTGPVLTVPDATLQPERAWSEELALEQHDGHGTARLALFNERVRDALIAQSAALVAGSPTLYSYVQNVPRTRARGVEASWQRQDVIARVDLAGSVTYADATTRRDPAFPAAEGKRLPSVPRWKATAVATWRPDDVLSLTAAARYASRNFGTLDNSDVVGNTYQGFYKYLVVDLRALWRIDPHYELALGVDNVGNDRYFLFHPFPQRSFTAAVTVRL